MSKSGRILRSHPNEKSSIEKRVEKVIIRHRDSESGQYVIRKNEGHRHKDGNQRSSSHGKKG